ncbi:hypothetical protein RM553_15695 [Zunongwangia sp. F363]|uniref:Uncharacterized protein n=1 Tax=Autumnicola tepida TaxID=3075595 RepID=A0ABU3CD93_9FLAO|nr:hypothetical protein [Zunongwangia sp. F363]MDT0644281.1 hypothetical protein [Zunongwangia sp. F363]
MKLRFLFLIFFLAGIFNLEAQEYWDREDFEISNRNISSALMDVAFSWVEEKQFSLPSGEFINKDPYERRTVDLKAVLARKKNEREPTVEIDFRFPEKKKKAIEVSGDTDYARDDFSRNSYYPYSRGFGNQNSLRYGNPSSRHYSNYRRIYF